MKKISIWAMQHVFVARLLVFGIKLMLAFLAICTGILFAELGILFSFTLLYFVALVMFMILLLYPSKISGRIYKKYRYYRQKFCDLTLASCSFIAVMMMANNPAPGLFSGSAYILASTAINRPPASRILESLNSGNKESLTRKEKKELKREFFKEIKIYTISKAKGDNDSAKKAWLIVLTIIAALGLTFLLTALVCSLSCNGSDVLAVIVALLGLTALIWGSIAIINLIIKGPGKKKVPEPDQ